MLIRFFNPRIVSNAARMIIVFLVIPFLPPLVFGEETLYDPDTLFSFADHLYVQNDHDAAIAEFTRFIFFYPHDERKSEAMFKTGMSHFRQGRYGRAIEVFDRIAGEDAISEWAFESAFMAAESYKRMNQSGEALTRLDILAREMFDPAVRSRALYAIGWILLEQRDIASAERVFEAINDSQRAFYHIDPILNQLDRRDELPTKSPTAAGIFSIVPGGGYLYTGRTSDALISFIFIAAGAGASYESFDKDLNVLGSILAVVTAGFYSGSIYGSIGAAHKYNDRVYDNFIVGLRRNRPDPGAPSISFHFRPQTGGAYAGFTYSF